MAEIEEWNAGGPRIFWAPFPGTADTYVRCFHKGEMDGHHLTEEEMQYARHAHGIVSTWTKEETDAYLGRGDDARLHVFRFRPLQRKWWPVVCAKRFASNPAHGTVLLLMVDTYCDAENDMNAKHWTVRGSHILDAILWMGPERPKPFSIQDVIISECM